MPVDSSPPQTNNNRVLHQSVAQAFRGPIPPPTVLAQYEELKEGLADRIVKMAENEGAHRRELEANSLKAQIEHTERRDLEARLGQIFGFALTVFIIIAGCYLILKGYAVSGSFVSTLGVSGIVTAFIYGRKREHS